MERNRLKLTRLGTLSFVIMGIALLQNWALSRRMRIFRQSHILATLRNQWGIQHRFHTASKFVNSIRFKMKEDTHEATPLRGLTDHNFRLVRISYWMIENRRYWLYRIVRCCFRFDCKRDYRGTECLGPNCLRRRLHT
jgi:hypothetical protein